MTKIKTTFIDEEDAIKVTMISYPDIESSKRMIVNVCYGYENPNVYYSLTNKERDKAIEEVIAGGTLPKALEMLGKFVFLIENISLTVTHCIVRHRFFTILQSSTAVKDLRNENFVMPRSFARNEKYYTEIKDWYNKGKQLYCEGVDTHGLSVQNARLLIPKNNCNHMFIGFDVKAFMEAYSQRTCTQEEPIQNNIIFKEMARQIIEKFPYLKDCFKSGCSTGKCLHSKQGKHANVVFKRDKLHQKFLPKGYLKKYPDKLLHNNTRDEMNMGPKIKTEKYIGNETKN